MPARFRLSHRELENLKPSKRVVGSLFSLLVASLPSRKAPGIACVVSKKVALRAHTRNLIKRRARAVLQKVAADLSGGRAYVFTARKGAADTTFANIERDIRSILARLH